MWRRKSVPAWLGEELVPVVHGRAPRATRRASRRPPPPAPAEQFGRLAHHYTEADLTEQAVDHWRRAGQRAIEQLGERRGGRQLAPVSMRSLEYRRHS